MHCAIAEAHEARKDAVKATAAFGGLTVSAHLVIVDV